MCAIAFLGQLQHEISAHQWKSLLGKTKEVAGESVLLLLDASGLFLTASKLGTQIEMIFDNGIDLMMVSEKSLFRSAGRQVLENIDLPVSRPLNLPEPSPGKAFQKITRGEKELWFTSIAQNSGRFPLENGIKQLETFVKKMNESASLFVYLYGEDLKMKQALRWYFKDAKCPIHFLGFDIGIPSTIFTNRNRNLFIEDVGVIGARDSISGTSPENWWKNKIERIPQSPMPDASPVTADVVFVRLKESGYKDQCFRRQFVI